MTKRYIAILTGLLIALVIGLCGCTTYENFKEAFIDNNKDSKDSINIGVYEPLAGADKKAAEPEVNGIKLAHKLQPELNGNKVNLIYADNNSDIDAAKTAITTLISKKPSIILGSYGNLYSLVASADHRDDNTNEITNIKEARIPAIAMTNTNPLITRNNSYYFRICYIDATQGKLLATYLNSIGVDDVDDVGVMLPQIDNSDKDSKKKKSKSKDEKNLETDEAAQAMATAFTNAFEEISDQNDAPKYYTYYTMGTTDFTDKLKALQETGVKYVLLPGENTDSINIVNQAAEMGLDVTFLGDMSWGEEDFHKSLSKKVDPGHLAFVQFFATDGDDRQDVVSEQRQRFLDAYIEEYGETQDLDEAVALGYDAYMLALDAIEKATAGQDKIASGTAIRDLLLSDDYQYEGASGTIRFNKYGDPKKTAYISTWDKDSVKAIYTIEADDQ